MFSAVSTLPFVPKKTDQLGVRCDPEWKLLVERTAVADGRSASSFVRNIVDAWLRAQDGHKPAGKVLRLVPRSPSRSDS